MSLRAVFILSVLMVALLWAAFGLLSGAPDSPPESSEPTYSLEERACAFTRPAAVPSDAFYCAELRVPKGFRLPVVVLRDAPAQTTEQALIYLQGGPGAAAGLDRDGIEQWYDWQQFVQPGRDLILLDPRGVGASEPSLWCEAYERFSRDILARPVSLEEELAAGAQVLAQCYADLAERGYFDPEDFGSAQSVQDLVALMDRLDEYRGFHLLGVSYGTRVAMLAAADSDRVLSVTLDSPFPEGQGGAQQWPSTLANALAQHFAWCEREGCYAGDQDYRQAFFQALQQLRETPWQLRVERWGWAGTQAVAVNDDRFLAGVFNALYEHSSWSRVPAAVQAVHEGEREPVRTLMAALVNLAFSEDWFSLVFYAVDCQDNPGIDRERYLAEVGRYPELAPYLAPLVDYWGCPWEGVAREEPLQVPLPEVPALILAGEYDPITPTAWAEQLHEAWPGSEKAIFEGRGHGVIWSDTDALERARRFWDTCCE